MGNRMRTNFLLFNYTHYLVKVRLVHDNTLLKMWEESLTTTVLNLFIVVWMIIIKFVIVSMPYSNIVCSSLVLQPWLVLGWKHKISPVASIICEVTLFVHSKCREVAMLLVLPVDAWVLLLPLSTHESRIKEALSSMRTACPNHRIRWIFMA